MEGFYVEGQNVITTTIFIVAISPWFMPLLFVIAGISSAYALNNRTKREYIKERINKLLIPFIVGLLLVVPAQTFFAERFHNEFTGSYLYQYILFFTSPTDLTGYRGGFTPAHLWFILFLFVISILALPIMAIYKRSNNKIPTEKVPLWLLVTLGIIPLLMNPILNLGGMSVGTYFAYFILGYLLLSNDTLIQKLDRFRLPLLFISLALMVSHVGIWLLQLHNVIVFPQIITAIFMFIYGWVAILTILGLGNRYLNFTNLKTNYLSSSAFPVYIFHQSWIITVAYFTLLATDNVSLQMVLILIISIFLTYATYEIVKRIPYINFLFGIKPNFRHMDTFDVPERY